MRKKPSITVDNAKSHANQQWQRIIDEKVTDRHTIAACMTLCNNADAWALNVNRRDLLG